MILSTDLLVAGRFLAYSIRSEKLNKNSSEQLSQEIPNNLEQFSVLAKLKDPEVDLAKDSSSVIECITNTTSLHTTDLHSRILSRRLAQLKFHFLKFRPAFFIINFEFRYNLKACSMSLVLVMRSSTYKYFSSCSTSLGCSLLCWCRWCEMTAPKIAGESKNYSSKL